MMKCLNNNREQQKASHAWSPAGHLILHKDILRALRQPKQPHTHSHTCVHTQWCSAPSDLGEAKPSSFQHYVGANCQRCLLLFHNDDQALQSMRLFSFFLLACVSPVCQMIKGFLWSYFSLPICIVWHMLSPIFPWPLLEPSTSI